MWTQSVKQKFSRGAAAYAREAEVQQEIAERLVHLTPKDAHSVLDVGCGIGFLTERLQHRYPNASITAIDLAEGMLQLARERCSDERTQFLLSDARRYSPTTSFDVVASSSVFQWIRPLPPFLSHLTSWLSEGGKLACAVILEGTFRELFSVREEIAPSKPLSVILPTEASLEADLRAAGFAIEHLHCEEIPFYAPDARELLHFINRLGFSAHNVDGYRPLSRRELHELAHRYDELWITTRGVRVTYRVGYVVASHGAAS